eukprot:836466-Prymnesium_polylepis.1
MAQKQGEAPPQRQLHRHFRVAALPVEMELAGGRLKRLARHLGDHLAHLAALQSSVGVGVVSALLVEGGLQLAGVPVGECCSGRLERRSVAEASASAAEREKGSSRAERHEQFDFKKQT